MNRSLLRSARAFLGATAVVVGALAALPAVAAAQTSTLNIADPSVVDPSAYFLSGPFGKSSAQYPASLAVGQTFLAPNGFSYLQSFSFWLANDPGLTINASALQFQAYVALWDGSKAGPIAYTSSVVTGPSSSTPQAYTFAGLNLALNPNQQYVAFFTSIAQNGSIAPAEASAAIQTVFDPAYAYSGGSFVSTNGSSFSDLTTVDWDNTGFAEYQTQFSAVFTSNVVPEPSSAALVAGGMFALLLVARRRRP